ncbi:NTP transferase domain-containing protein [Chloroflexota bacterium]
MISGILLAGGESKRMGEPKLLMPFHGRTILGKVVEDLLDSDVGEVVVVVGHMAEKMRKRLLGKPVKLAMNMHYRQGISSSIVAGLGLIDNCAKAVMIALGDQPLIGTTIINKLVKEYYNQDKGIVIPTYEGRRGHPVIFSIRYKNELLGLKGDVGARQLFEQHLDDITEVVVNSSSVIIDIDNLSDYRSLAG